MRLIYKKRVELINEGSLVDRKRNTFILRCWSSSITVLFLHSLTSSITCRLRLSRHISSMILNLYVFWTWYLGSRCMTKSLNSLQIKTGYWNNMHLTINLMLPGFKTIHSFVKLLKVALVCSSSSGTPIRSPRSMPAE